MSQNEFLTVLVIFPRQVHHLSVVCSSGILFDLLLLQPILDDAHERVAKAEYTKLRQGLWHDFQLLHDHDLGR